MRMRELSLTLGEVQYSVERKMLQRFRMSYCSILIFIHGLLVSRKCYGSKLTDTLHIRYCRCTLQFVGILSGPTNQTVPLGAYGTFNCTVSDGGDPIVNGIEIPYSDRNKYQDEGIRVVEEYLEVNVLKIEVTILGSVHNNNTEVYCSSSNGSGSEVAYLTVIGNTSIIIYLTARYLHRSTIAP